MATIDSAAQAVAREIDRHITQSLPGAVRVLLAGLGEDPSRPGLQATPDRVVRSLMEMTKGYREDPAAILSTTFEEPYEEMVVVAGIEFWSLCEHHLIPFHGTAAIGYIPSGRVVGLSKLPRLVHCFAQRLQVQERLTEQIARAIDEHLKPKGVGVLMRAEHLCMKARGVKSTGTTTTSCLLGAMYETAARAEFLTLASGPPS